MDVPDADGEGQPRVAKPKRRRKPKDKHRDRWVLQAKPVPKFADLGPPPLSNPLALNGWMHRSLGVAAAQTLADPNIDEETRRSTLCKLATQMTSLTPQARIHAAQQVVEHGLETLAGPSGPQMEAATDATQGNIERATGGGAARRGRPRKRSIS